MRGEGGVVERVLVAAAALGGVHREGARARRRGALQVATDLIQRAVDSARARNSGSAAATEAETSSAAGTTSAMCPRIAACYPFCPWEASGVGLRALSPARSTRDRAPLFAVRQQRPASIEGQYVVDA